MTMSTAISREEALTLLKAYNSEPFHLAHALTLEGVMAWFANNLGYGEEAEFWALVGLLPEVDFEQWPAEHCKKVLKVGNHQAEPDFVHAVCHGYGQCSDVALNMMEKVLFAVDELTGLIGAAALMRPAKGTGYG